MHKPVGEFSVTMPHKEKTISFDFCLCQEPPAPQPMKPVQPAAQPKPVTNGNATNSNDPVMGMSAKEMREFLASRRKQDPKKKRDLDFATKVSMLQKMWSPSIHSQTIAQLIFCVQRCNYILCIKHFSVFTVDVLMDFHVTLRVCDMKKCGIIFPDDSEEMMITRIDIWMR